MIEKEGARSRTGTRKSVEKAICARKWLLNDERCRTGLGQCYQKRET